MSPLPLTPSTNGGFLSRSQDVTASQPVPAPSGKGGKKDSALKIKLADHCEKKEVEIPLEKLRWDEKMQFGQIRKWSEDEVLNKVKDPKERPPTTLIRIVIWGDGSMLPSVRTVCCFVTNNVRRRGASIACPKLPLTLIICDWVQYQVGSTGYCLAST